MSKEHSIQWLLKSFDDLRAQELYAILQLRNEVFVVEQNCVFQDADDKDQGSWHLMGWKDNQLFGYTRLLPAGLGYEVPSIGRVVSSPKARGTGVGRELMKKSIEECERLFNAKTIRIGAQLYLRKFYESFGFVVDSEVYLEDGIEHVEMVKTSREDV